MLLAIDTSTLVLSCALAEEDRLIAEWTTQKKLTHSEQLIPQMEQMLSFAGVDKKEITAIAVSKGPGSFTGLRIGLATAKMCAAIWKIPLVGVSTLEALAWNMKGAQAFILPLEDAQRGNVYTALYGSFEHIWEELPKSVLPIDTVIQEAVRHGGPVIAVGESADVYKEKLLDGGIYLAPAHNRCCRGGSVAMAAMQMLREGRRDDPLTLIPDYIRRSEAEVLWEKRHPEG